MSQGGGKPRPYHTTKWLARANIVGAGLAPALAGNTQVFSPKD